MNDLDQLVLAWLDCAEADDGDASRASAPGIKERLRGIVQARRNCAWELQRLLRQMEKENPPSGGLIAPRADLESA